MTPTLKAAGSTPVGYTTKKAPQALKLLACGVFIYW